MAIPALPGWPGCPVPARVGEELTRPRTPRTETGREAQPSGSLTSTTARRERVQTQTVWK